MPQIRAAVRSFTAPGRGPQTRKISPFGLEITTDLEHDLASSVPGSDPRQRLAGLVERQYRFGLRAEFAGIDQGGQLLQPRPAAAGSE
jgi:hypothetical protein